MTPKESIESVLLETFQNERGRTGQVQLEAPLTLAELAEFQEDQSAPLPAEIRELLRFTRGFSLLGENVDFQGTNQTEFEPSLPGGIPLHSDGFGSFWIVHVDPGTGAWAPILFAGHHPPVLVIQSQDLGSFLEEFFNTFRPGKSNALLEVYRTAFDIWRLDRGLYRVAAVRESPDAALRAFAKDLKDEDYVADLRSRIIGSGFSWARCGSAAVVQGHPSELLYAVITPRRKGGLARLFGF